MGPQTYHHVATLIYYMLKGAGLVTIKVTGVKPTSHVSPNYFELRTAAEILMVRRGSKFINSPWRLSEMQLFHTGRKASKFAHGDERKKDTGKR